MNVSGIRPYSGFYNVNTVPPTVQEVEESEIRAVDRKEDGASLSISREAMDAATTSAREQQTFGSYDYAKQYRPEAIDTDRTIGSNADINNLDVIKAVSDMHKDEAIQQYQVFVGTGGADAAAAARGAENFTL